MVSLCPSSSTEMWDMSTSNCGIDCSLWIVMFAHRCFHSNRSLTFAAWDKDYISQTPLQLDMVMWQGSGQWDVSGALNGTAIRNPPAETARFLITLCPFVFPYSVLLVGTWMWWLEQGLEREVEGHVRGVGRGSSWKEAGFWGVQGADPAPGLADFCVREKPTSLSSGTLLTVTNLLHRISKKSWLFKWGYRNSQNQMHADFHNNHPLS